jgi:sterol desaturase/sphingolipid hydroxylase (fatty acid hydroxylase superfamily)
LQKYWVLEFLFCSFFGDVLFYVLHRAVHSKGLYQRLHKMHHEWIYTMALAHHYMDPLEGKTPLKWFLSWVAVGGSGQWVVGCGLS